MIKWKRPSKTLIETNDTEGAKAAAKALGWTRVRGPAKKEDSVNGDGGKRDQVSTAGNISAGVRGPN